MTPEGNWKDACLFIYDIPDTSNYKNPSRRLEALGVRANLSCWFIPTKNVTALPIDEMNAAGCDCLVVEFKEHEWPKIVAKAREVLSKSIEGVRDELEKGAKDIMVQARALGPGDEKEWTLLRGVAYRQLKKARDLATSAADCALAFDLLYEIEPLRKGMLQLAQARTELYMAELGAARKVVFPDPQQKIGGAV